MTIAYSRPLQVLARPDVAYRAGVGCEVADPLQPMSLVFRLGGVQLTRNDDVRELQDRCGSALARRWRRRGWR